MSGVIVLPSEFLSAPIEIPCHIDGLIQKNALIGIVAEPAAGKTFLTLSMALSMAARIPWFGHEVDAKGLLYVCGEGFPGMPGRVLAWCAEHEVAPERLDQRIGFCRVPFDISDMEMLERIRGELAAAGIDADVIIIDTVSSNSPPGFDENATAHMKAYMDAARRLRDALQCTVIFVHHMGHAAVRERGSSDFRGSMDVMMAVKVDGDTRTLSSSKLRDLPPFEPITFTLKQVDRSAVAVPAGRPSADLLPSHRQLLSVLASHGNGDPLKAKDWQRYAGAAESTFYRQRLELLEGGFVLNSKNGYVLTRAGEKLLNIAPSDSPSIRSLRHSHESPRDSHGTPTTLSPLKGESESGHKSGKNHSHGTPMGLSRECGPGLEMAPWDPMDGAA